MTVPNKKPRFFGIVELWIVKQLTDVAGQAPTYDDANAIKIDGIQNLTYEGDYQEIEGRGDERVKEVEIQDDKAKVGFESLYFPLAAAQLINGGTIVEGTDDAEYFEPGPDEIGDYFKIMAITKPRKEQLNLYKVRGRLAVKGLTGGQFVNASFSGTAIHTEGNIQGKPRRYSLKQSSFAMYAGGVKQVETATVAGTITTAGNATFTVTGAGITGSPKAVSVAVALNDSAAVVAQKARETLALDSAVTALFDVGGVGTAVMLTRKVAAANDATLNIAIANGTCAGLTAATTSANTTAGQAG